MGNIKYGEQGEIVNKEHSTFRKALPHIGGLIGFIFSLSVLISILVFTFIVEIEPQIFTEKWYYTGFIIAIISPGLNTVQNGLNLVVGRIQVVHATKAVVSGISALSMLILAIMYPFSFNEFMSYFYPNINFDNILHIIFYVLTALLVLDSGTELSKFLRWEETNRMSLLN